MTDLPICHGHEVELFVKNTRFGTRKYKVKCMHPYCGCSGEGSSIETAVHNFEKLRAKIELSYKLQKERELKLKEREERYRWKRVEE